MIALIGFKNQFFGFIQFGVLQVIHLYQVSKCVGANINQNAIKIGIYVRPSIVNVKSKNKVKFSKYFKNPNPSTFITFSKIRT